MRCYCGTPMVLKRSRFGRFWACPRPGCDGVIGAHQATGEPLGIPADAETRQARITAHAALDRLWTTRRERTRTYGWLAAALGLSPDETHIARFDRATCERVIRLVAEREANP